MIENYLDASAVTTVAAGGYTSGSGVLNVGTTGSPFGSPSFSIAIVSASTGLQIVLLQATAINSGTQWAVTAEGADASASAGDNVYAVLSARSLDLMRANINQVGTYASLPSTPRKGDRYSCTDVPLEFVYNGSSWDAWYSGYPVILPPAAASWTLVNSGSSGATKTDDKGGLVLTATSASAAFAAVIAAPSTPYTAVFGVERTVTLGSANGIGPLYMAGATTSDKLEFLMAANDLLVQYQPNFSSFGSNPYGPKSGYGSLLGMRQWYRLKDDGTNRSYAISANAVDWDILLSESHTSNFTPTNIGLLGYSGFNSDNLIARLFSLKIT